MNDRRVVKDLVNFLHERYDIAEINRSVVESDAQRKNRTDTDIFGAVIVLNDYGSVLNGTDGKSTDLRRYDFKK